MAASPSLRRLSCAAAALSVFVSPALPQAALSLEQAESRRPPDYLPVHYGQRIAVHGQVVAPPVLFHDYAHIGIQDCDYGLTLETAPDAYPAVKAGDLVEAAGVLSTRGGLPVLRPDSLRVKGHAAPPAPLDVAAGGLQGFRQLGRLVRTEGRVTEIGETISGPYMLIRTGRGNYKIFLPFSPSAAAGSLDVFEVGDKVRAIGLASQYCSVPPYNRWFQLLVREPADIARTEKSWIVPREAVGGAVLAVLLVSLFWWSRDRRLRGQREAFRRAYQLTEEILGAASVDDILKRLTAVLPRIFHVSSVRLYLHNRGARALDPVRAEGEPAPASIALGAAGSGAQAGAVACFHYRTLLAIPDAARSPFPVQPAAGAAQPRALLFVPMFAQGELIGVLEMAQRDRRHTFTADEQTLAQHLGNQVGTAIRLLEQRSVREQLYRTEKLAAVGKLVSGLVNELQAPLESIGELTQSALAETIHPPRELDSIATEARRAAKIVTRLISFASSDQVQARPVDLNRLLRNLVEFREQEWKSQGIRLRDEMARGPLCVLGAQGQLEQVFLNMLVHTEQLLAESEEKTLSIRTGPVGNRILVEISYSGSCEGDPFAHWPEEAPGALGLGVCRGIIAGHGGEVRVVQAAGAPPRFEVELPCAPPERQALPAAAPAPAGDQTSTALVIEPEEAVERQLLQALAARAYRVVPVRNADSGLDLAQRLRFDVVFCSVHAPGLNWVELSEEMQSRVGGFVLLSDGYDPELAQDFEADARFVLSKPLEDRELERVLLALESAAAKAGGAGVN